MVTPLNMLTPPEMKWRDEKLFYLVQMKSISLYFFLMLQNTGNFEICKSDVKFPVNSHPHLPLSGII